MRSPAYRTRTAKHCRKCEKWLRLEEFPANARSLDGCSSWCRRCHVRATQNLAHRERANMIAVDGKVVRPASSAE